MLGWLQSFFSSASLYLKGTCVVMFFLDRSVCVCVFALRRLMLWCIALKTWRCDFWLRVCVSGVCIVCFSNVVCACFVVRMTLTR